MRPETNLLLAADGLQKLDVFREQGVHRPEHQAQVPHRLDGAFQELLVALGAAHVHAIRARNVHEPLVVDVDQIDAFGAAHLRGRGRAQGRKGNQK